MKTPEENLKKLSRTSILKTFVVKNDCDWDHTKWLEFCAYLEEKGYTPIDFDQVGLLLEKKKAERLAEKDAVKRKK